MIHPYSVLIHRDNLSMSTHIKNTDLLTSIIETTWLFSEENIILPVVYSTLH